jgi:hypothetical protein
MHAWHAGRKLTKTLIPLATSREGKMVLQLIIPLSILLSSLLTLTLTQSAYPRGLETTLCIQNVTFLHFIPCWRALEIDGIHRSAAPERLNSCDLLARAAVDLAIERVNENQNEIFGGSGSRYVRTVPLFPETNDVITVSTIDTTIE